MNDLTPEQLAMFLMLQAHPGMMHVTPDGNHIYFLLGEGENQFLGDIERISDGKDFNDLNENELNELLSDYLTQLFPGE